MRYAELSATARSFKLIIKSWRTQFRNGTKAINLAGAIVHPNAFDSTHLPDKPTTTSAVNIASIGNLQRVNRLLTGQTLTFGTSPGITSCLRRQWLGEVFGYARVIKRACRSRGAVPAIHVSDVFAPVPSNGAKPSCDIMIQSAGSSIQLTWTDGVTSDPRLANVFVFDTAAAAHYLTTNAPCTFTPYGLDVLPKLVEVCDPLTKSVKATIAPLEQQIKSASKTFEAKFTKQK